MTCIWDSFELRFETFEELYKEIVYFSLIMLLVYKHDYTDGLPSEYYIHSASQLTPIPYGQCYVCRSLEAWKLLFEPSEAWKSGGGIGAPRSLFLWVDLYSNNKTCISYDVRFVYICIE